MWTHLYVNICELIHTWTHSYVNSFICEFIHMWAHSYVNSFICELIHMWIDSYVNWSEVKDVHEGLTVHHSRPWGRIRIDIPSNVPCSRRTAPLLCTLVYLCDVTHLYMRQDSQMCDMARIDIYSGKRCVSYHTSIARIDILTNVLCHVTRVWPESIYIQSNVACHIIHLWVLSHIRMSHVTQVNEFSNKFQKFWGLIDVWHDDSNQYPVIWMSHVTHMNESCRIHEWVMSHLWLSHVAHIFHSYNWILIRVVIYCV